MYPIAKYAKKILMKLATKNVAANITYRVCDVALPVILIIIAAVTLVGDSYNPFLYFQF